MFPLLRIYHTLFHHVTFIRCLPGRFPEFTKHLNNSFTLCLQLSSWASSVYAITQNLDLNLNVFLSYSISVTHSHGLLLELVNTWDYFIPEILSFGVQLHHTLYFKLFKFKVGICIPIVSIRMSLIFFSFFYCLMSLVFSFFFYYLGDISTSNLYHSSKNKFPLEVSSSLRCPHFS